MARGPTNVVQNRGDGNNIKGPIRKQQGLGCASDMRGAGVNRAVSGDSQHFLKQVQGNWPASGAVKQPVPHPSSRMQSPSAWKASGDLLQPLTDRFKGEVPAAVVARGNIARIEIKARHGGT